MEDSSEVTEAAAGVAAEAVEVEIPIMQTMKAMDMSEEAAETMDIDMEGRH